MRLEHIQELAKLKDKIDKIANKIEMGGLPLDEQIRLLDLHEKAWSNYNKNYKRIKKQYPEW